MHLYLLSLSDSFYASEVTEENCILWTIWVILEFVDDLLT